MLREMITGIVTRSVCAAFAGVILAFPIACATSSQTAEGEAPLSRGLAVYNGSPMNPAELPEIVKIRFWHKLQKNNDFCSATLIGQKTLLTAAHCVLDGKGHFFPVQSFRMDPTDKSFKLDEEIRVPVAISNVVVPSQYDDKKTSGSLDELLLPSFAANFAHDLALILLDRDPRPWLAGKNLTTVALSSADPRATDELEFVGYGENEKRKVGKKSFGKTHRFFPELDSESIRQAYSGFISIRFDTNEPRPGHGDSGGPILNSAKKQVGVASHLDFYLSHADYRTAQAYFDVQGFAGVFNYVNVTQNRARLFFEEASQNCHKPFSKYVRTLNIFAPCPEAPRYE